MFTIKNTLQHYFVFAKDVFWVLVYNYFSIKVNQILCFDNQFCRLGLMIRSH